MILRNTPSECVLYVAERVSFNLKYHPVWNERSTPLSREVERDWRGWRERRDLKQPREFAAGSRTRGPPSVLL
jgi:hypothetical protein